MSVNKVVLAYSGGLDTSVIVRWLQETYDCEVVTFTADLGQKGCWKITGDSIIRYHNVPRQKLFTPRECVGDDVCPLPDEFMDVMRNTTTDVDSVPERYICDVWDGVSANDTRELSEEWTGQTQFTVTRLPPKNGYE